MDFDSTARTWLDIAHDVPQDTSTRFWQDEPLQPNEAIQDPICLFGEFVAAVSSDSLEDAQRQLEVSRKLLCCLGGKAKPLSVLSFCAGFVLEGTVRGGISCPGDPQSPK